MKRVLTLLLAFVVCFSLCACSNQKDAQAKQKAKEAYDFLAEAYAKTDEIGSGIYGVWALNVPQRLKQIRWGRSFQQQSFPKLN